MDRRVFVVTPNHKKKKRREEKTIKIIHSEIFILLNDKSHRRCIDSVRANHYSPNFKKTQILQNYLILYRYWPTRLKIATDVSNYYVKKMRPCMRCGSFHDSTAICQGQIRNPSVSISAKNRKLTYSALDTNSGGPSKFQMRQTTAQISAERLRSLADIGIWLSAPNQPQNSAR